MNLHRPVLPHSQANKVDRNLLIIIFKKRAAQEHMLSVKARISPQKSQLKYKRLFKYGVEDSIVIVTLLLRCGQ